MLRSVGPMLYTQRYAVGPIMMMLLHGMMLRSVRS